MRLITLLVCVGLSLYSLITTLTTTRRVAKQRDDASEAAHRWMCLYFDAMAKLDAMTELKKEAQNDSNHSPYPEGMSQAEYFGITPEKAEED